MPRAPETPAENSMDRLICHMAERLPDLSPMDVPLLPEAREVDSFRENVQSKAWWCYQHVAKGVGRDLLPIETFLSGFGRAWSVFYWEAAKALAGVSPALNIKGIIPQLLCIFHFPEYPRLSQLSGLVNVVFLVKRRAPWMGNGPFICVDDRGSLRKILGHLRQGGTVLAMIDHAFSTTHNRVLEFLGQPCQTPFGLFEVAMRLSISVGLVLPRPTGQWTITRFEVEESAMELAQSILNRLSKHIMASPERWLLWPNLNHRWVTPLS